MSKDRFALAYSIKRMAKQRGRVAPQLASEPSEALEPILEAAPSLEEDALPAPVPLPKVDIGKLIKKHRFFGSKI